MRIGVEWRAKVLGVSRRTLDYLLIGVSPEMAYYSPPPSAARAGMDQHAGGLRRRARGQRAEAIRATVRSVRTTSQDKLA